MRLRVFDAFGNSLLIKRILIFWIGCVAYYRFNVVNKTRVTGSKVLKDLPKTNVLFVCNHQTYFADVVGLYQVFGSAKWNMYDRINRPWYLLNPRVKVYFVAAKETMRAGILPKIFAYAGSVSIKRSWREAGKEIQRGVDPSDIEKIYKALDDGWVITFPQGTTTPFVPGRRGTAKIIKEKQPVVVPVVFDGFRRAFDKKGILLKKRGSKLSIRFKEPLTIDYNAKATDIMAHIMDSIEQSQRYNIMKRIQEEKQKTLTNREE